MAYLPPAGKRDFSDFKLSYLPTMSEIRNPAWTDEMLAGLHTRSHPLFTEDQLPPLKGKSEEWIVKPPPKYPIFYQDCCPLRPFCLGIPAIATPMCPAARADCNDALHDPRELPYGLPPISYGVKKRADWFDHWKEDHYKYAGAFQMWEQRYGEKYFYTAPKQKYTCIC